MDDGETPPSGSGSEEPIDMVSLSAWRMLSRTGACLVVAILVAGVARGQPPASPDASLGSPPANEAVADAAPSKTPATSQVADLGKVDDLLKLDIDQLSNVRVGSTTPATNPSAPSSLLSSGKTDFNEATSTGELLKDVPSASARRTSAINLDPRVRGYNSAQLNASANGITQLKTRLDIDSVFSQIDPGVVQDIRVINGPYTSLYGPGFAFLVADLFNPPRYDEPQAHGSTYFTYGSNGQTLYNRDNLWGGGKDWGIYFSYGVRQGNDYQPGGTGPDGRIPSSYQKWDGLLALSFDMDRASRVEFNYLRTEMNNVELPGVVYDLDNSKNDQFSLRYVMQDDRNGPEQAVLQTWWVQTAYHGDALRESKQTSLYYQFFTLPNFSEYPVNTVGKGDTESLGVRALRTFGEADSPQLTLGVDWRRNRQSYAEQDLNAAGQLVFDGNVFGIPQSQMDDVGCLVNLLLPVSDAFSISVGGRVDWSHASFDAADPVVTEFSNPDAWYFSPGFDEPSHALGMAYVTGNLKLSDHYTLNAGTAYATRMPDLAELYTDEPYSPVVRFGNSYLDGNSTLVPEKNWQVDLGITCKEERLTYGARGFYSTIHDYITLAPVFIDPAPPNAIAAPKVLGRDFSYFPDKWRQDIKPGNILNMNADTCQAGYEYVNIDLATLFGGDVFAEVKVLDWLSLYGSMTYVRGTNQTPVVFVAADSWSAPEGTKIPIGHSEALPGIYPFNGMLAVRTFDPQRQRDLWGVELSSRMVYRQDYLATSLSELGTPGFAVFDVHAYYRVQKNVRLTLAVKNLLDRNYVEPGSQVIVSPAGTPVYVPEPGISVLVGLDARF